MKAHKTAPLPAFLSFFLLAFAIDAGNSQAGRKQDINRFSDDDFVITVPTNQVKTEKYISSIHAAYQEVHDFDILPP